MKLTARRTYLGDRICFPEIIPDRLIDVQAVYAHQLERGGAHREDAIARSQREIASDLPALLQADPDLAVVHRVHEQAVATSDRGDLAEDCLWSAEKTRLGPPIGRPGTVWGMTGNYPRTRSAANSPADQPRRNPTGFLRASGSLAGPYDVVRYPAISQRVDPELELAVVVGRRAHGLTVDSATAAVAGYVGFCDISARDVGEPDNRRVDRAKGFDTFGIVGPWFVTEDEIADPRRLRIRFWVNGEPRQDGSTAEMVHRHPRATGLAHLSAEPHARGRALDRHARRGEQRAARRRAARGDRGAGRRREHGRPR